MDAAFAAPQFSAKAWVNAALREAGGGEESLEKRLSLQVTKLQHSMEIVDAEVHRRCTELAGVAADVSREIDVVREQAGAVRSELAALLEEVGALEDRSEASVATLRDVLRVRERFASVAETLQQAERVASLLQTTESAFARGDAVTAAGGVGELGAALDSLGAARTATLFPEAAASVEALRRRALERLEPELLEAIREHDSAGMLRLSTLFRGLGSAAAVRTTYVQCAQGPIFQCWNAARRAPTVAEALSALWAQLEALVPAERAWVAVVFAADDALLPTLLGDALIEMHPQMEERVLSALRTTAPGADAASGAGEGGAGEGGGAAGSDARARRAALQAELGRSWTQTLEAAGRLASLLGGASARGVPRIAAAMLEPFAAAQERLYARALLPYYLAELPPLLETRAGAEGGSAGGALATNAIEHSLTPLKTILLAAASAVLEFGGPLATRAACDVVSRLAGAHAQALARSFHPIATAAVAAAAAAATAAAAAAAAATTTTTTTTTTAAVEAVLQSVH